MFSAQLITPEQLRMFLRNMRSLSQNNGSLNHIREADRVSSAVGNCSHQDLLFRLRRLLYFEGFGIGSRSFEDPKSGLLQDSVHMPFLSEDRIEIMGYRGFLRKVFQLVPPASSIVSAKSRCVKLSTRAILISSKNSDDIMFRKCSGTF